MEILKIVILSFSSAIILFILTKLMGNKEMSQLIAKYGLKSTK